MLQTYIIFGVFSSYLKYFFAYHWNNITWENPSLLLDQQWSKNTVKYTIKKNKVKRSKSQNYNVTETFLHYYHDNFCPTIIHQPTAHRTYKDIKITTQAHPAVLEMIQVLFSLKSDLVRRVSRSIICLEICHWRDTSVCKVYGQERRNG